jgi:hypothetical protein
MATFEKELGSVIKYAIDNFREGKALMFNKFKTTTSKRENQDETTNLNYQIFDAFLQSRDITDPYTQCAKAKSIATPSTSKDTVSALKLHDCPLI